MRGSLQSEPSGLRNMKILGAKSREGPLFPQYLTPASNEFLSSHIFMTFVSKMGAHTWLQTFLAKVTPVVYAHLHVCITEIKDHKVYIA